VKPVIQPQRSLLYNLHRELEKIINELLHFGIIKRVEGYSPRLSLAHLVPVPKDVVEKAWRKVICA